MGYNDENGVTNQTDVVGKLRRCVFIVNAFRACRRTLDWVKTWRLGGQVSLSSRAVRVNGSR